MLYVYRGSRGDFFDRWALYFRWKLAYFFIIGGFGCSTDKKTVKKIFFWKSNNGFLLMALKLSYMWNVVAKFAKTRKSIFSRVNPTNTDNNELLACCSWKLGARSRRYISSSPSSAYTNPKTPKIIQSGQPISQTRPQHWYLYIIFGKKQALYKWYISYNMLVNIYMKYIEGSFIQHINLGPKVV